LAFPVNPVDFTVDLPSFLATAVGTGTWQDVLGSVKLDARRSRATDVANEMNGLWRNTVDSFIQASWDPIGAVVDNPSGVQAVCEPGTVDGAMQHWDDASSRYVEATDVRIVGGAFAPPAYTVAGTPSVVETGRIAFVTDEIGGTSLEFSDGTNWMRADGLIRPTTRWITWGDGWDDVANLGRNRAADRIQKATATGVGFLTDHPATNALDAFTFEALITKKTTSNSAALFCKTNGGSPVEMAWQASAQSVNFNFAARGGNNPTTNQTTNTVAAPHVGAERRPYYYVARVYPDGPPTYRQVLRVVDLWTGDEITSDLTRTGPVDPSITGLVAGQYVLSSSAFGGNSWSFDTTTPPQQMGYFAVHAENISNSDLDDRIPLILRNCNLVI
jgi:hypothetical protein